MAGGTVPLAVEHDTGELPTVLLVHVLDQEGSITERSGSGTSDDLVVSPPLHLLHWIPGHWTQEEDVSPGHASHIDLTSAHWLAWDIKINGVLDDDMMYDQWMIPTININPG